MNFLIRILIEFLPSIFLTFSNLYITSTKWISKLRTWNLNFWIQRLVCSYGWGQEQPRRMTIYRRCSSRPAGLVVRPAGPTWGPLGLIPHQMVHCFMLKQILMAVSALSVEIRPERCMVLGGGWVVLGVSCGFWFPIFLPYTHVYICDAKIVYDTMKYRRMNGWYF